MQNEILKGCVKLVMDIAAGVFKENADNPQKIREKLNAEPLHTLLLLAGIEDPMVVVDEYLRLKEGA